MIKNKPISYINFLITFFLFFLSIFFIYALCAFPSADDWGYGVLEPIEALKHYYMRYHGRFFSNYLISWIMNTENFIFSYRTFFFFSYTLLFTGIIAINSLLFGNKKIVYFTSLLLIAAFLFRLPGKDNSYYWLAAHSNYLFSVDLLLYSFLTFLLSTRSKKLLSSYSLAFISAFLSFLSIGCNEFYIIYIPLTWCFFLFIRIHILRESYSKNHALLILILFSVLGALLAGLAPGHSYRHPGPPASILELSYLLEIVFVSPIDLLSSMLRLYLNPLFLLSLPLLAHLYTKAETIKKKFELLQPYRNKFLLFFLVLFITPFIIAQIHQTHVASRSLVPHYFLLALASYILLFLYIENQRIKKILEKAQSLKKYAIPAIGLSLLLSVPFQMWLDLPNAIKFQRRTS